jgi:magnesium-transporting ATPase (P-type)
MNAPTSTSESGLSPNEVAERLRRFGPNALPEPQTPSLAAVFLRQFLSPLIYILLAAAVVSAGRSATFRTRSSSASFCLSTASSGAPRSILQEEPPLR